MTGGRETGAPLSRKYRSLTVTLDDHDIECRLNAVLRGTPLRVQGGFDTAGLRSLVARCDGVAGVAEAIAPHAARLGTAAFLDAYDRGPMTLLANAESSWARWLRSQIKPRDVAALKTLAWFSNDTSSSGLSIHEAFGLGVSSPERWEQLQRAGIVKLELDGCVRARRPWSRVIVNGGLGDATSTLPKIGAWASKLVERAEWCGDDEALAALTRHRGAFLAVSRVQPGIASLHALVACGYGSSVAEDTLGIARALSSQLAVLVGVARRADVALSLAEFARREGQLELLQEAIAIAQACDRALPRAEVILARSAFNRGQLDEAQTRYRHARQLALSQGDAAAAASALLGAAWNDREQGALKLAETESRRAAKEFGNLGGKLGVARARMNEALIALSRGDGARARLVLDAEIGSARDASTQAAVTSFVAMSHEIDGEYQRARLAIEACLQFPVGAHSRALFEFYDARISMALGRFEHARSQLDTSLNTLEGAGASATTSSGFALRAMLAAHQDKDDEATRDLSLARRRAGSRPSRKKIVRIAQAVIEALRTYRPVPGVALNRGDANVRVAVERMTRRRAIESVHIRCFARLACKLMEVLVNRREAHEQLVIDASSRTVLYRSEVMRLDKHPLLFRVLMALIPQRPFPAGKPATVVSAENLIAMVWPGELITPSAAKNRIRVAVHELRARGLHDAISGGREGYALTAELALTAE